MSGFSVYDLYRGKASLWVEDELTRESLSELWGNSGIGIHVANSKDAVKHMVAGTPKKLEHKVYGLVDCDFEQPDEASCNGTGKRVFRTPCHEFENLLLDFDVLATLARDDFDAEMLRSRAEQRVRELLWWMSCKATLREIRGTLVVNFPGDPRQTERFFC
jgi:hypothetical protein